MKDHELNLLNILTYIICRGKYIIVIILRMSLFAVLWYIPPRTANP